MAQMVPRILLVMVGLPVLIEQNWSLGDECKSVLEIAGRPVLGMNAWLAMQIFTDIAIIITRAKRHSLTASVVRAFMRGEGVEASRLRKDQRARLFTTFMRHKLSKLSGATKSGGGAELNAELATPGVDFLNAPTLRR